MKPSISLGKEALIPLSENNQSHVLKHASWTLDYRYHYFSKNAIALFLEELEKKGLSSSMRALLNGEPINSSENRAVLHPLLRQFESKLIQKQEIFDEVLSAREKMKMLSESIRTGAWKSASNERFQDVVNIGIGGSYLGPKLAYDALESEGNPREIRTHFLANIDPKESKRLFASLNPKRTLIIISSKSMSTSETKENAKVALDWIASSVPKEGLKKHFMAVTSKRERIESLGIPLEEVLPMWDWVGGRYSVWSSIGFPLAISFGYEVFSRFLKGAESMDEHFFRSPLESNIPVILATISLMYRELSLPTHAILAYHHGIRYLPEYLQQLDMESNGKSVTKEGEEVSMPTAPLTWGSEETNAQHSFHQLLHQGTDIHPADFILSLKAPTHALKQTQAQKQQNILISNALGQREVLLRGRGLDEVLQELLKEGFSQEEAEKLAPHKCMKGGRPSSLLYTDELTPEALGALLALYEHKTFVMGIYFGINSFDQWGVELGKRVANELLSKIESKDETHLSPAVSDILSRLKKLNP